MNEQQLLDQPHARHSTKKLCYVCKYVDGTFRVVREPFRQLFFVRAFVKSDRQLKQVPLAFVLMTSLRRVDYVYAFCNRCSTHCRNLRQFRQSSPTSRRHSGRPSETSFLASLSVGASSISHRPCGGTSSR